MENDYFSLKKHVIINVEKRKKMKKKQKILIVLFFIIVVTTLILFFKKPKELTYQKEIKLKIGEKVPTKIEYQLEKKTNTTKITWKNLKLENENIYHTGNYQGNFTVNKKTYPINLTVTDNIKPTIENVKNLEIYENEEIDLLKEIKVTDNSHDKIEINVIGEYDVHKKGEYNLTYEAKDKSGNKKTESFKLIVKEISKKIEEPKNEKPNQGTKKTSKGYSIEVKNGMYYIGNILIANKTYALPSNYAPGLLPELTSAFETLKQKASEDGIELKIVSGFRSYNTQNRLYSNYVARDGKTEADTYSARPGHSEHQTGLAIDVNSLLFSFGETKEGKWLQNNAYKYGFIIRYPKGKENITGYQYEPWHLRYVGDLSKKLYNGGNWITLEEYLGITSEYSE